MKIHIEIDIRDDCIECLYEDEHYARKEFSRKLTLPDALTIRHVFWNDWFPQFIRKYIPIYCRPSKPDSATDNASRLKVENNHLRHLLYSNFIHKE